MRGSLWLFRVAAFASETATAAMTASKSSDEDKRREDCRVIVSTDSVKTGIIRGQTKQLR